MSYCINPDCSQPQNQPEDEVCRNCGSNLLLRGRYRAVKVLGQGGFGKTFLAIDQDRLNASCVIKQFLPQMHGTGALEKATELFNQEAVRLYELGEHPQIPDLLAFFVQDKRQYLVQEFVPGMDLQKLLNRYGKFSEEEIWYILRSILPVLEFVHDRQVIHRDIKPENIIRRQGDNLLYLIDFGVAKLLTSPDRVITGTSIGTSGYVPIEQMSEGKAYPASDIYSLGVTCFHLLTGISPYTLFLQRGYSWLQTWQTHLDRGVSGRLIKVLDRMMKENRHDRYASAREALQDIERLGNKDTKIRQETAEDQEYISNFLKEIVITSPKKDEGIPEDLFRELTEKATDILPSDAKPKTKTTSLPPLPKNLPSDDDRFITEFIQDISSIEPAVTPRPAQPAPPEDDEFITEFIQDITSVDIDEEEIEPEPIVSRSGIVDAGTTAAQIWRCERTLRPHDQGCSYVGITPRGTLVTAGVRRVVSLWDMETGLERGTLIKEDTCSTCSGLGKVFKENTVLFVKAKVATVCPDCEGFGTNSEKGERFLTVRLSDDGNTLVTSTLDRCLKLWSLGTGKFKQSISTEPSVASLIDINGNGRVVCYVLQNRTAIVYDMEQHQEIGKLKLGGIITCLDIDYEGNIIILGMEEGVIHLWDVSSDLPPLNAKGHRSGVSTVALSSDSLTAVSGCRDGIVKVWNVATGNLVHSLKHHLAPVTAIAIGADNIVLATGSQDGVICLWDMVKGRLLETFTAHTDRVTAIAAGADGQTFASASLDCSVKIWRSF